MAVLLRLAASGRARVPGRSASVATVAPVHPLRGRLDGPPGAVVGAVGPARGAVLGRAESVPTSTAPRSRLSEAPDLARGLCKPLRRRGCGAKSVQALHGDRTAADALAGLRGPSDPVGGRVLPRFGLRVRRGGRRIARVSALFFFVIRPRPRYTLFAFPALLRR